MADSKSLMGLNLSVDNDLIAEAVRESIIASVAAGLSNKEQIVSEFVKASLTERVLVEDGSKPRYSNDKTCTRMEYVVRKAIIDIAREEVMAMVEEQKPVLRDLVRKEFQKEPVQSKFVEMFMNSLSDTICDRYRTKINVEFQQNTDY